MKNYLLYHLASGLFLCASMLGSCMNEISDEEVTPELPIQFSTHASGNTQLPQQGFRENDAIGLYGLIHPNTFSDSRYLNNIKLTCDASLNFIPEKEIFFPKGDNKVELIGYFPYRKAAIGAAENQMKISVHGDQTGEESFMDSDFRIARTGYQLFTDSQVTFNFRHTGCLLKVKLINASTTEIDLTEADMEVSLHGFYTQSLYDMDKEEFADWEQPETITPFGTWNIQEKEASGKQAILIPQPFRKEDQYLKLVLNQKTHICPFPETMKLESGKICELTIRYKPEEREIDNVICQVEEWMAGDCGSSDAQELKYPIYLTDLPFDKSAICRISHHGTEVAEVCKEFISCEQVEAQAIVVYPVRQGKSDLTQGRILQLLGVSRPIHGGTLIWDLSSNRCSYTEGNRLPLSYFFIDYDGSIVLSLPQDAQQTEITSLFLTDIRQGENIKYPVVKIGTQYWMQDNLKTTRYNNGDPLPKKSDFQTSTAGYVANSRGDYFYNEEAVKTGKLPPAGWRLPETKDWEKLLTYIQWDASVLKNGIWAEERYPVNNLTGFNGQGVGLFVKIYTHWQRSVGYWTVGKSQTDIPDNSYFLMFNSGKVEEGKNAIDKGLSIRCIRE